MDYFVSTGEVSGDLHLSYLVEKMLELDKNTRFYGVAGSHSFKSGVNIIQNIDELAIMGFTSFILKYSFLKKKALDYIEFIKKNKIKKVILIDYGGFHLRFMKLLKSEIPDIEIYYYIPPKLWAWGKSRIKKLKIADHIIVIFPWEKEFYEDLGINAIYYGNPLVDKCKKIERTKKNILLLPGSRKQEILSLIPEMIKLAKKMPKQNFLLKLVKEEDYNLIKKKIIDVENIEVDWNISLEEAVSKSEKAIAASGTVILELALMQIPSVVIYKTSILNELIARYVLNIKYISLPNIILKKTLYKELLQRDVKVKKIIIELNNLDESKMHLDFEKIRENLGGENIIEKYANYILGKEYYEKKNI